MKQDYSLEELLDCGVVIIDKPCGPSSHEVSAFVRKILGLEKTGHTGTLDPQVSGVLPVLLGNACKASPFLIKERKKYVCVMRLNAEVSQKELLEAFSHFKGEIYQKPPSKSAVAKRLRTRTIYSLNLLELNGRYALFDCDVEGGFYVRTLCYHVGEVLGCGAQMLELRRTEAAGFTEEKAVTLQQLSDYYWLWKEKAKEENLRKALIPLEEATHLKKVMVYDDVVKPITTGANLAIPGIKEIEEGIRRGETVQILREDGRIVCFAHALKTTAETKRFKHGLAFDISRVIRQASHQSASNTQQ